MGVKDGKVEYKPFGFHKFQDQESGLGGRRGERLNRHGPSVKADLRRSIPETEDSGRLEDMYLSFLQQAIFWAEWYPSTKFWTVHHLILTFSWIVSRTRNPCIDLSYSVWPFNEKSGGECRGKRAFVIKSRF